MTMEAHVVSNPGILRQTWCGNVDIGLQSPKCDLQEALIHVLCQVDMFAFRMFLCVHQGVCTICSNNLLDRGQRVQRTRLCASTWCVRVRQGVLCVLFLSLTGFRQISDCFKWARKVQSVEMYIIAISLVVD